MTKSKFVFDKLAKIFEQGLINYKDLSNEILNILKSKRDEIVFKMKLTSKEETDILSKRIENLEKKIDSHNKLNPSCIIEEAQKNLKDISDNKKISATINSFTTLVKDLEQTWISNKKEKKEKKKKSQNIKVE